MWDAVDTRETRRDAPQSHGSLDRVSTRGLWGRFLAVWLIVGVGGWAFGTAAEGIVEATGLKAGFVGGVLMGMVNALPETVTAIAAVRRGAITLAIAAIIGGNCLDALNLVVGDAAFRGGSLFHAAQADELFVTAAGLFMTAVVLAGMLVRQPRGWGRVGFEGVLLLGSYLAIVAVLAT